MSALIDLLVLGRGEPAITKPRTTHSGRPSLRR